MTNLSNLIEILAKQALDKSSQSSNNQNSASQSGLGGVLGSVLGQILPQQNNQSNTQQQPNTGLGGILGSVLGQLGGQAGRSSTTGSSKSALLVAVLPIILAWIQKQGGVQGALEKLKQAGMGSQVQSWVSPEEQVNNEQVDSNQMQFLFDEEDIAKVADQTQQPKENIYAALASALPQIIDSLTPNGDRTDQKEANTDIGDVLSTLSGYLRNK